MAFVPARSSRADLIGREREIKELAAHRRAAADGHGRIVLIGGEAGIGKSQLLRHFAASVASGRAMVVSSRCVEFMQRPLSPLRELLSQLERRESAPRDVTTQSLVEGLAFDRSADPSGTSLPGGPLFDSIDAAFARYALRGTVVLLVEDIHWADRSTLAFLNYLADTMEKRRILVVATYRSDEVGSQHPQLSEFAALLGKRSSYNVLLPPLDPRSTRELLERAAAPHALSSAVVGDIVRRSQGNAFFAEELLKTSLESHHTPQVPDLPLSIRGAVLALASRLSDEDRHIISLAAVLGERFSVDQLVALMQGDREAVLRALERARALHLVYDEPAAPGEVAFRHALTQEVLYGELLAERVRPLHEAIAGELERQPNPEAASVELAHHWRRAGDLERAAAYDETAGDRAAAIGAFADAILYYERARVARKSGSAELEHKLGVVLGSSQELNAGIERLRHAGELYWSAGDFKGFSENASALAAHLYNKGEPGAATALCHETIAALRARLPREELDLFRARLAFHSLASLDDESASAFLDEISEPITDPKIEMHAIWSRSRVAAMRGEIDSWRVLSARALDAARRYDGSGSWLRFIDCQVALDAIGLARVKQLANIYALPCRPRANGNPCEGRCNRSPPPSSTRCVATSQRRRRCWPTRAAPPSKVTRCACTSRQQTSHSASARATMPAYGGTIPSRFFGMASIAA
ncbi:MAG: AAA family ATPase [Candidatus Cybelea sp.]